MPSLSDSELSARRTEVGHRRRPRHFLRRGAVTELTDPSTGNPILQGIRDDRPMAASLQGWEHYNIAARPERDRDHDRPAPEQHVRLNEMSTVVFLLLFSLTVAGLVIAKLAADAFLAKVHWRLPFPSLGSILVGAVPKASEAPSPSSSPPWFKSVAEVGGIMFKGIVTVFGGNYMINNGTRCLIDFLPAGYMPRSLLNNGTITQVLTLIGFAILPTATSATFSVVAPGSFCDPKTNIFRFWPPRTRDDIKAMLDGWVGLAGLHFKMGGSMTQMAKWTWTFGRASMWLVGIGLWTTVEIYFGPCRYYPLVWRFWFSVMSVSLVSWFLGNADKLIVTKCKSIGLVHLELVAYLAACYVVRWAELDGFCSKADCW
ncbi:hypothetical protein CORC01_12117 [Colletotrichum orchidophilum]|uniref:Uncharacterized protein n=1 Tax=Colletotrichum orchidophilum TaxID=1209926 RepID=A0A1G4AU32_9PEZI|nr:uncharacterized protein CORC01_12117 [Colletotrichum orchidophilum]OHE92606.1 hypothetical protein CORC01_12117 [Colletotrichum orchidophilum]